ncbi:MAG: hypothetical protein DWQ02_27740 [Bacteroidetes bacterium]|nr:MAG: hypothetical protein DWQ02_27740 [Bacteroidota bacterium]
MKDSKLIKQLGVLTWRELNSFGDFVHSPFFNKHKETSLFLELLKDRFGRWDSLSKEDVFKAIYPGEKYKEHAVNNLMFNLSDLFKQFLGQKIYADKKERQVDIIEGLLSKKTWKAAVGELKKELKKNEQNGELNSDYFFHRYKLNRFNDEISNMFQKDIDSDHIQRALYDFETWFLIEKMKIICDLQDRMVIYNHKYDLGVFESLLEYIEERWEYYSKIPTVNLYYHIIRTYLDLDREQQYYRLVEILHENRERIKREELERLYNFAINLGIVLVNQDRIKYSKSVFNLYSLLVEDGFHLENGEMSHMMYKNLIVLACFIGEFEWARKFMDDNKNLLNPEIRKNVYNFNLAYLYSLQEQYQEALVLLSKLDFENVFYQINAKVLQLKIFYELKEYEVILSFIDSFKSYLTRNKKVSSGRIKLSLNFLLFMKKLVLVLHSKETMGRHDFEKKLLNIKDELIQTDRAVIGKDWIMEKVGEMLQSSGD